MSPEKRMQQRLERLQEHLKREAPVLVDVVDRFRRLDRIAKRMGLMTYGDSFATQISWWPMISILGTFSAGKSSFINSYVERPLQKTGNQAVDDRFTVISYSHDDEDRVLPGLALDGDPRFPFYRISKEIEKVTKGEGDKIDSYLQMKVISHEALRGKILIDSPGFDADEQRKSILRITDHIISLSDLVMVFFDARHPEPGAMQDTLSHLVKNTQKRSDSSKFLFILNQIDTSAKEDNLEEIVSSWQKALIQSGMTTGRFYLMYNKQLAVPVENENVWARYELKRDHDYAEILSRMDGIGTERVYRIVGSLESLANQLEHQAVPRLQAALQEWKKRVLLIDAFALVAILTGVLVTSMVADYWDGLTFSPPWLAGAESGSLILWAILGVIGLSFAAFHFYIRNRVAKTIAKTLPTHNTIGNIKAAFLKSTTPLRSIFQRNPKGWGAGTQKRLTALRDDTERFVQKINDRFTQPSG